MTIIHIENSHAKINIEEETEIMKAAIYPNILDEFVNCKNVQLLKIISPIYS